MQKFLILRALTTSVVLLIILISFRPIVLNTKYLAHAASTAPRQPANVVVCLRVTGYKSHDSPVAGDPSPTDAVFDYQLLNKGSVSAMVTGIRIVVYGPLKSNPSSTIPTTMDATAQNLSVGANQLTPQFENRIYVGPGTETSHKSADSHVTWVGGGNSNYHHNNSITGWTNDPGCGA